MKNQLIEWIIQQNNKSEKGRLGLLKGNKELRNLEENHRNFDLQELLLEARELEKEGLLKVKFYDGYSAIEKITYHTEDLPEFYRRAGEEPPWETIKRYEKQVEEWMETLQKSWILEYCRVELAEQLKKGNIPQNLKKQYFLECLKGLDELSEPMFKRMFSIRYLGSSKEFERNLEKSILTIAKKYCLEVEEMMDKTEILSQIFLEEYSQMLWVKGNLKLKLEGELLDLSKFCFGTALNTQTLKRAEILKEQNISKIITVENKANFESMEYEEETLFIFTHGFLAPLECSFLKKLKDSCEKSGVAWYHTGDLDLGGVKIFGQIRKKIQPDLQPLQMDVETFRMYKERGYGERITEKSYLNSLKKFREPALKELIAEIIKEEWIIEQECFLI